MSLTSPRLFHEDGVLIEGVVKYLDPVPRRVRPFDDKFDVRRSRFPTGQTRSDVLTSLPSGWCPVAPPSVVTVEDFLGPKLSQRVSLGPRVPNRLGAIGTGESFHLFETRSKIRVTRNFVGSLGTLLCKLTRGRGL